MNDTYPIFTEAQIHAAFMEHVEEQPNSFLFTVVKPMLGFKYLLVKKADGGHVSAIANIIVPEGATVHASFRWASNAHRWTSKEARFRKFRADRLYVHSIVNRFGEPREYDSARSWYDAAFRYQVGTTATPGNFAKYQDECAPGLHFFLDLWSAMHW